MKEALEIGLVRGRLGFVSQAGLPRSEWSSPYTYRYTLMVAVLSSGEWLSAGRIKGFNVDWDSSALSPGLSIGSFFRPSSEKQKLLSFS